MDSVVKLGGKHGFRKKLKESCRLGSADQCTLTYFHKYDFVRGVSCKLVRICFCNLGMKELNRFIGNCILSQKHWQKINTERYT